MGKVWYKSYPKEVPYHLDYEEISLFELLKKTSLNYPENIAIIYDEFNQILKYKELYEIVLKISSGLINIGVNKDDKFSFLLPNVPSYIFMYYSVLATKAVVVNINPELTAFEIKKYILDSDSKYIITFPLILNKLFEIPEILQDTIVLLSELMKYSIAEKEIKNINENMNVKKKLAVLQYTGGTTGVIKAAMLSHFNLVANSKQIVSWVFEFKPENNHKTLNVIPLFHAYGMTVGMNVSVRLANSMVLLPQFSIEQMLRLISKYKIDFFPAVPAIYNSISLYAKKSKVDISSIKVCISGAAPLNYEIYKRFTELTNAKLVEGYGLSEASPVTHINPIFDGENRIGTIGLPIPDTDAKVIDIESGKELSINEEGELIIKGPQIMLGYYKNQKETNNSLKNGYLYTGDIVKMDQDGYFKIIDRKKEMIIISGFKVFPKEVEEVLYSIKGVVEAAVVGVNHPSKGQIVKAFIVKNDPNLTESDIIRECKNKLSQYKIPREIQFVDNLPKNQAGKILKRLLV
jgi:long-chain acyl-CoA synthetase